LDNFVVGLLVLAVTMFLMGIVIFIMARSQKLKEIADSKWPQRLTKEDTRDVV
jgi:steroid 5-alpha reductase family enzyme